MKNLFILIVLAVVGSISEADDLAQDFDSLGGNQVLLERAKGLRPETKIGVVQNRSVKRAGHFEVAPGFSGTFGGDTYVRTQTLGINFLYHVNYNWTVGVKYGYSINHLTPEGEALVDRAVEDYKRKPSQPSVEYPELDYPKNDAELNLSWYPVYGKINILDKAIAHFDFYTLAAIGRVEMKSGSSSTYSGGIGLGFWLNPKVTTRLEMRYQNLKGKYFTGEQSLDFAVASVQVGWLL